MKIAQFKGISRVSKCIRFLTRSEYSHSGFLFDTGSQSAFTRLCIRGWLPHKIQWHEVGATIEAWNDPSAVANCPSVSTLHTEKTQVDIFEFVEPLSDQQEEQLLIELDGEIGTPYNWRDVLRFVTHKPGKLDNTWFCSELVFAMSAKVGRKLLVNTEAWEVPPGWIQRSPLLRFVETVET